MEVLHQLIVEPNFCQCYDSLQAHSKVQRKQHTKQLSLQHLFNKGHFFLPINVSTLAYICTFFRCYIYKNQLSNVNHYY